MREKLRRRRPHRRRKSLRRVSWIQVAAKYASWSVGFNKVLDQVYLPHVRFGSGGRDRVMQCISRIAEAVIWNTVSDIVVTEEIALEPMQNALGVALTSGELQKRANAEVHRALAKFHHGTREAGLQFAWSDVQAMFAKSSDGATVSDDAAVALATVLEYMCAELLDAAGKAALDEKKRSGVVPASSNSRDVHIEAKHVDAAVDGDVYLRKCFATNAMMVDYNVFGHATQTTKTGDRLSAAKAPRSKATKATATNATRSKATRSKATRSNATKASRTTKTQKQRVGKAKAAKVTNVTTAAESPSQKAARIARARQQKRERGR